MAQLCEDGAKGPSSSSGHAFEKEESHTLCLMALLLTSPIILERSTMTQGNQLVLSLPLQKHHHRRRQMEDMAGFAFSHVSASMLLPGV